VPAREAVDAVAELVMPRIGRTEVVEVVVEVVVVGTLHG